MVANVPYEASLFQCAGMGLSSKDTYLVYCSLVALQKDKDLSSVRFFGKILGAPNDYYIAEAVYNTPPEPETLRFVADPFDPKLIESYAVLGGEVQRITEVLNSRGLVTGLSREAWAKAALRWIHAHAADYNRLHIKRMCWANGLIFG